MGLNFFKIWLIVFGFLFLIVKFLGLLMFICKWGNLRVFKWAIVDFILLWLFVELDNCNCSCFIGKFILLYIISIEDGGNLY